MRQKRSGRLGLSISEVMVAAGVLLALFAALTMIYTSSSRVWRKVDRRTSLLRELTLALRHLERDLEVTDSHGLSSAENAVCYLSTKDEDEVPVLETDGRQLWQKFVVVFLDSGRLRKRVLPLSAPSVEPMTFQDFQGQKLGNYLGGAVSTDRFLTHSGQLNEFEVKSAELFLPPSELKNYGSLYEITVRGEREIDSQNKEKIDLTTRVSLRNRG